MEENDINTLKNNLDIIEQSKSNIKAAIAGKGQEIDENTPLTEYAQKISSIETGVDTSDATAAANKIAKGYTAYVKGNKITGTLNNKSNAAMSVSDVTIDYGSNDVYFRENFIAGGLYIDPGNNFSLVASFNKVANKIGLTPEKIVKGVTILGVTGILANCLTFATEEEMNEYTTAAEDTYAIVYGTTYVGTYRFDDGSWVKIGDASDGQDVMNALNSILDTTDQYEGIGGTEEELNEVFDDILGEE